MKSENFLPLLVQFLKLFHIANAKITTQNVLMQYLHHTNKPSLSELVKHILHLKVTFVFHTKQQNTKNGGCRQQQPTGGNVWNQELLWENVCNVFVTFDLYIEASLNWSIFVAICNDVLSSQTVYA